MIQYTQVKGFNLSIPSIEINSIYYPLSSLSEILGYASPQSLIQSLPKEYKISVNELYSLYSLYMDQFLAYAPPSIQQFKKGLSMFKPLWFTTKEGLNLILSKNTFTIPRLKQAIAESLGFTIVSEPHKESTFYSILQGMLEYHKIPVQRHLYLAGYFADLCIEPLNIIVEYDENGHKYYSKEKEIERETALKQLGYKILRIDDSLPPEQAALSIYYELEKKIDLG